MRVDNGCGKQRHRWERNERAILFSLNLVVARSKRADEGALLGGPVKGARLSLKPEDLRICADLSTQESRAGDPSGRSDPGDSNIEGAGRSADFTGGDDLTENSSRLDSGRLLDEGRRVSRIALPMTNPSRAPAYG